PRRPADLAPARQPRRGRALRGRARRLAGHAAASPRAAVAGTAGAVRDLVPAAAGRRAPVALAACPPGAAGRGSFGIGRTAVRIPGTGHPRRRGAGAARVLSRPRPRAGGSLAAFVPSRPAPRAPDLPHPARAFAVGLAGAGRDGVAGPGAGAGAAFGLRVRAGARALPPAAGQPLAAVLGGGGGAVSGLAGGAGLAGGERGWGEGAVGGAAGGGCRGLTRGFPLSRERRGWLRWCLRGSRAARRPRAPAGPCAGGARLPA